MAAYVKERESSQRSKNKTIEVEHSFINFTEMILADKVKQVLRRPSDEQPEEFSETVLARMIARINFTDDIEFYKNESI